MIPYTVIKIISFEIPESVYDHIEEGGWHDTINDDLENPVIETNVDEIRAAFRECREESIKDFLWNMIVAADFNSIEAIHVWTVEDSPS